MNLVRDPYWRKSRNQHKTFCKINGGTHTGGKAGSKIKYFAKNNGETHTGGQKSLTRVNVMTLNPGN